jgi:hypothetical protein
MTEIDLIPQDYRRYRRLVTMARTIGFVMAGLVIVSGAAAGGLMVATNQARAVLEEQEQIRDHGVRRTAEFETRDRYRQALNQQLLVLRSLRSGAPAEKLFATIDNAIGGELVWFDSWRFRRAGVIVPSDRADPLPLTMQMLSQDHLEGSGEDWLVETHMQIRGKALDHKALSSFVTGLFSQDQVSDVRVQRTTLREGGNGKVVEFELAIVLKSLVGESS